MLFISFDKFSQKNQWPRRILGMPYAAKNTSRGYVSMLDYYYSMAPHYNEPLYYSLSRVSGKARTYSGVRGVPWAHLLTAVYSISGWATVCPKFCRYKFCSHKLSFRFGCFSFVSVVFFQFYCLVYVTFLLYTFSV